VLFVLPVALASYCNVEPTSAQPIKVIIPLYVDPSGGAWDEVIAIAHSGVSVTAIINPNSGPAGSGSDSEYITLSGIPELVAAGITVLGYVHTSYGARALSEVEADINTYGTLYEGLSGIFLDEAANTASEVPYYKTLYHYITGNGYGYTEVFLNPGTSTVEQYLSVSTNIMIYEDSAANLARTSLPSWVLCANTTAEKANWQYHFSGVAYAASSSQMSTLISDFHNKGVGYVYITDGAEGCCTYNSLASFLTSEGAEIKSLNQ